MKIHTELISKNLLELKNDILDICTNENLNLSYFEPKIANIEHLTYTLDAISPFIDDKSFITEFTALNIISERILDNQFEFLENDSFRNAQINALYIMGIKINLNDTELLNIDIPIEEELNTNDILENKDIKSNQINNSNNSNESKKEIIKKESEKLVDKANESLKSYFKDPKLMKEYLDYMSKFYNYSERNTLLINEQFEGAKAVGSFKFWSKQGYKINKGEKGIKILVPVDITYFKDKNNNEKQLKYATKEEKEKIKNKEIETYARKYFNIGYVFDISQTNAPLEDLPKIFPNRWLDGDVANYDKMYHALEVVATKIGVKIIEPKSELGYIKGISYTETKEVALNPRNGELQNIKTLIHELAHAKLHTLDRRNNYSKSEREYQAEMVAYSTCSYFGLDTSDYSLDYLDNWTKNMNLDDCKNIIKEVKETTAEYIEIIENELMKDNSISLDKSNVDNWTKNMNLDDCKNIIKEVKETTAEYIEIIENELMKDNSISLDKSNGIKKVNVKENIENDVDYNIDLNDNSKKLSLNDIYIKFISSDSKELNNGDTYDFKTANEIVSMLSEKYVSLDSKKLSLNDIYIKFISSDSKELNNGDTYDFKTANEIVSMLSEKYVSLDNPMNTKFELYTDKNCSNSFYSGSINIGDGLSYDIQNHLFKAFKSSNLKIDDNTRNMLIDMFKPNFDNEKEKDIYVKFVWSEHDKIKDNSIFKYKDADKLLETLTDLCKIDKKHLGYYKTSFELHYNKECNNKPFYSGRFDIGDGYARNLSNHIDKFVNLELDNIDINVKNKLFKTLGINSSYIEKQIDTSLSL